MWDLQARDDRLQRLGLEGEVALYKCKGRDDTRQIDGLQQERASHLDTIAALEAQLRAAQLHQAAAATMPLPAVDPTTLFTEAQVRAGKALLGAAQSQSQQAVAALMPAVDPTLLTEAQVRGKTAAAPLIPVCRNNITSIWYR